MGLLDSKPLILGVHIAQSVLAVIVLGLTAYVVTWVPWSEPSFLLFCAIWTLLVRIFLQIVPGRFSDSPANHPYVTLSLEAVTMIFWFAGFIALAVPLGPWCDSSVCGAAKAATAFGAFEWVLFVFTTTIAVMVVLGKHNANNSKSTATPSVQQGV